MGDDQPLDGDDAGDMSNWKSRAWSGYAHERTDRRKKQEFWEARSPQERGLSLTRREMAQIDQLTQEGGGDLEGAEGRLHEVLSNSPLDTQQGAIMYMVAKGASIRQISKATGMDPEVVYDKIMEATRSIRAGLMSGGRISEVERERLQEMEAAHLIGRLVGDVGESMHEHEIAYRLKELRGTPEGDRVADWIEESPERLDRILNSLHAGMRIVGADEYKVVHRAELARRRGAWMGSLTDRIAHDSWRSGVNIVRGARWGTWRRKNFPTNFNWWMYKRKR